MNSNRSRIAFLISGRGSNMKAILNQINKGKLKVDPVLVFSDNREAMGLKIAQKYKIATYSFHPKEYSTINHYENELVKLLKENKVEWIICAGYMRILRDTVIDAYHNHILNIHPSLLPAFPGLKAQKQALEYGVKVSGCTVHLVDKGVDTGPIIMQTAVPVKKKDNVDDLSKRILKAEHDTYWRAIDKVVKGIEIKDRIVY